MVHFRMEPTAFFRLFDKVSRLRGRWVLEGIVRVGRLGESSRLVRPGLGLRDVPGGSVRL